MLDSLPTTLAQSDDLDPVRDYVGAHGDALLSSAELLAGRRGQRLALAVMDGLSPPAAPSRQLMRQLAELRDILLLEHVADDTRDEAHLFAAIDPADPAVAEICLLVDGLCAAIAQAEAHAPAPTPAKPDRRMLSSQQAATITRDRMVVHPARPFASETRRRRRPVPRSASTPRIKTAREDAR